MVKSQVMEQSRAEGEQASLLRILRGRTKQEIPKDLIEKINDTVDRVQLQAWIDLAINVDTIDDFRKPAGL
jgi:hypothetical protein